MSKKAIVNKSYKYHKILIINDIYNYLNHFKSVNIRMACKRSSVRLRYSPLIIKHL
jgi:hypothetical protein